MRAVQRSAIVPFTVEAMFDLVADVPSYPEFLPGCTGARIESAQGEEVVATLILERAALKTEFTTRNRHERPQRISMRLERGPFSQLDGVWEFVPLGTSGARVSLQLSFAFDNRAADFLLGPLFESLCAQLVDAFVSRARVVYSQS